MRCVTADGRAADTGNIEPAEAGGLLAEVDVPMLRAFLIRVALAGGARKTTIAKALRCTPVTIRRDIKASGIVPGLSPGS